MKKYISIFLSVCAAVLYGCTDMEDALTEGILSVESETLWFDAAGGSQLIEMRTYAGSWTISQDEDSKDWCGLSKTEGTTSSSFEVTVQPNDDLERTTTLVLDAPGCEPVNIRIIQNGEKDNQFTVTQEIDGEMVEFNPDPVDGQVPYLIDPDKPLTITFKPSVSNTMFGCRNDVYAHIGIVDGDFWKYTASDFDTNAEKGKMTNIGDNTWVIELTPTVREWFDSGTTPIEEIGVVIRPADMSTRAFKNDKIIRAKDSKYELEHKSKAEMSADLPDGMQYGINYGASGTEITFVLKEELGSYDFAYLIGDFNDWTPSDAYAMHWDGRSDKMCWWITLDMNDPDADPATMDDALDPDIEYMFQYYIGTEGGEWPTVRLSDPFSEIIYSTDDRWITSSTYPGLPEYPSSETTGLVSAFQVNCPAKDYVFQYDDFRIEDENDLVIYELLLRDFTATGDIRGAMDRLDYLQELGVTAIELMPVQEFDGNDSWGYNPNSYFAMDKAYGTREDYKAFIDRCHKLGIAVFFDVVYNHMTGASTPAKMYWNSKENNTHPDNPWFNEYAPHPFSVYQDLRNSNTFVKEELVKRSLRYLVEEYHVDGFRFDLTKGLTDESSANDCNSYNPQRVSNLKEYYDVIRDLSQEKGKPIVMICEHFCEDREEQDLAGYGIKLWKKCTEPYYQSAMGYSSGSDFRSAWTYLAWGDNPSWFGKQVAFMESHDEERQQYKVLQYAPSSVKDDLSARMQRSAANAAFFFTFPGPKMLWEFGELGYDISIEQGGRTAKKPVHWEYYDEPGPRRDLYESYAGILNFRKDNPEFFDSGSHRYYAVDEGCWSQGRYIIGYAPGTPSSLNSGTDRAFIVLGNFDTDTRKVVLPDMRSVAGSLDLGSVWRDYFDSGITYTVDPDNGYLTRDGETAAGIVLGAGEYVLLVNYTPENE